MHQHISGIEVIKIGISAVLVLGFLNLIALHTMDRSKLAASYANLFGLS